MRKVDLFLVGAPKCGTTAMDYYLSQHPEIYMAPQKECHHFATDLVNDDDPMSGDEGYARLFDGATNEKILGESSVFYMLSRDAAQNIRDYNKDARILIMLRNPVDVLASHHSQVIYVGRETETDLARALELEASRRHNLPPTSSTMRVSNVVLLYRDVVRFSDQVSRFMNLFGKQRVHVVLFDDLKRDTAGVYRGVLEFLDADPTFGADFRVVNENKTIRSAVVRRFLQETPDWLSAMSRLVSNRKMRVFVLDKLKRINSRIRPRTPMEPALRARLTQELKAEILALASVIDKDLSAWIKPL